MKYDTMLSYYTHFIKFKLYTLIAHIIVIPPALKQQKSTDS